MKSILTTTIIISNAYHTSAFLKPSQSRPLHLNINSDASEKPHRNLFLQSKDDDTVSKPFGSSLPQNTGRDLVMRRVSLIEKDARALDDSDTKNEKIDTADEGRIAFPEIASGEVPRMFSNISFKEKLEENGNLSRVATHAAGSTISAAALVSGTTIGAGVLALPTATAPAGFLPSSAALCVAWFYMTISGLLIAELSINKMGETGKQGVGLLELFRSYLGKNLARVGSAAYFFFFYAVLVAFLAEGGSNLGSFFDAVGLEAVTTVPGLDQLIFAGTIGGAVYFGSPSTVEKINNVLVLAVVGTFIGIIGTGTATADFNALVSMENQHAVSTLQFIFILRSPYHIDTGFNQLTYLYFNS